MVDCVLTEGRATQVIRVSGRPGPPGGCRMRGIGDYRVTRDSVLWVARGPPAAGSQPAGDYDGQANHDDPRDVHRH